MPGSRGGQAEGQSAEAIAASPGPGLDVTRGTRAPTGGTAGDTPRATSLRENILEKCKLEKKRLSSPSLGVMQVDWLVVFLLFLGRGGKQQSCVSERARES